MYRARRTWINTAVGCPRNTVRFGLRRTFRPTGLPTATVNGQGRITTVGPGWIPLLGDGLRTTTAAGFTTAAMAGPGGRELWPVRLTGVRRWSDFSAGAGSESVSALAASVGARSL